MVTGVLLHGLNIWRGAEIYHPVDRSGPGRISNATNESGRIEVEVRPSEPGGLYRPLGIKKRFA